MIIIHHGLRTTKTFKRRMGFTGDSGGYSARGGYTGATIPGVTSAVIARSVYGNGTSITFIGEYIEFLFYNHIQILLATNKSLRCI